MSKVDWESIKKQGLKVRSTVSLSLSQNEYDYFDLLVRSVNRRLRGVSPLKFFNEKIINRGANVNGEWNVTNLTDEAGSSYELANSVSLPVFIAENRLLYGALEVGTGKYSGVSHLSIAPASSVYNATSLAMVLPNRTGSYQAKFLDVYEAGLNPAPDAERIYTYPKNKMQGLFGYVGFRVVTGVGGTFAQYTRFDFEGFVLTLEPI